MLENQFQGNNRRSADVPLLSLVIPCCQSESFLAATFSSIREQEVTVEVIVVDGGSTDGTHAIVEANRDLVTRFVSEPDNGQSDAIHKGFKLATGSIFVWLNSDDTLAPGALRAILSMFEQNPNLGFVYGRANKIDANSCVIKEGRLTEFDRKRLLSHFFITQPACFFRRDAYFQVGGLDLSLNYAMDWDLLLKLSQSFEGKAVDHLIANLRIHGNTKTELGGYARSKEIARVGRRHGGVRNRNWIAFQLLRLWEPAIRLTGWRGFLSGQRFTSRLLDRCWGHGNYMIHAHTFRDR